MRSLYAPGFLTNRSPRAGHREGSARLWTRPGSRLASAGDLGLDRQTTPRAAASGAPLPRPPARRTPAQPPHTRQHPATRGREPARCKRTRYKAARSSHWSRRTSGFRFHRGRPSAHAQLRPWDSPARSRSGDPAACPPHHRGSRFPRCGKWSPRESRCHRRPRHESRRSQASSRLVRRALGAAFWKRPPPVAVPASYRAGDRRRPAFHGRASIWSALVTTAGRADIAGGRDA